MITAPPPAWPWPNQLLLLSQLPAPAVVAFGICVQLIIVPIGEKQRERGGSCSGKCSNVTGSWWGQARDDVIVHSSPRVGLSRRQADRKFQPALPACLGFCNTIPPPLRLSAIKSFLKFNTFMACWWQVKATGSTLHPRTTSWKVIKESQPSKSRLVADILLMSGTIVR